MKNENKLKLGIVGHGFVGKATDIGFNQNVDKLIVDPKLGNSIADFESFKPEIVFICVPTPMDKNATQDSSILISVTKELNKICPKAIKVIKSTVLPSILNDLIKLDKKLIYNPEFLREKNANEDFINSELIIFGGDKKLSSIVSNAYIQNSACITSQHYFTDLQTASLIKYTINSFLASKVIFFNGIHSIFESINPNDSWEKVINIISKDSRIGTSHMNVPGHDGKKGFGGACFPKDSLAFAKYAKNINEDFKVLETTIKVNNNLRKQYSKLDPREVEQNISFKDNI